MALAVCVEGSQGGQRGQVPGFELQDPAVQGLGFLVVLELELVDLRAGKQQLDTHGGVLNMLEQVVAHLEHGFPVAGGYAQPFELLENLHVVGGQAHRGLVSGAGLVRLAELLL